MGAVASSNVRYRPEADIGCLSPRATKRLA